MANDEIITEIATAYSKMSLLELLAEENMMAKSLHNKEFSPLRKHLQQILRLAIEKKLV
jgi:hypothetical protein